MFANTHSNRVVLNTMPESLTSHRRSTVAREQRIAGSPFKEFRPPFLHILQQPVHCLFTQGDQSLLVALASDPNHALTKVYLINPQLGQLRDPQTATEGNRERLQAFEGVVIGKRNRGMNSSFTVRKISYGVGVERTFQSFSKLIESISVKRRGDVRQAKLYYLRDLSGKAARIKEKLG